MEHPYVPRDVELPGYVPGSLSPSTILGVYGPSSLLLVSPIWLLSGGRSAKRSAVDRLLMCWWAFAGLNHLVLDLYYVLSPEFYKNHTAFYLAEVWKEYSKGDSRLAARDAGVVAIAAINVREVPLCLLSSCWKKICVACQVQGLNSPREKDQ